MIISHILKELFALKYKTCEQIHSVDTIGKNVMFILFFTNKEKTWIEDVEKSYNLNTTDLK